MIEFDISDQANQQFSVVLNNRRVTIKLWYSVFADRWSMDFSIDAEPVLTGRKIVEGVDLLAAFNLGVGVMFAFSESQSEPGRDQLPNGLVKLYHTSEEELNASVAT